VLGPDEAAKGQVAVKNLLNGEQTIVPQETVVEFIQKIMR